MNEHRRKIWARHLEAGRVRYAAAEYYCEQCHRWHRVPAPRGVRSEGMDPYTIEEAALDAMRSGTVNGCPNKFKHNKSEPPPVDMPADDDWE